MKITPPADDGNIQGLKSTNRASQEVKQTGSVEPYPPINPSQRPNRTPAPVTTERRRGDRRKGKGERRQSNAPVLLDTRSPHERRTKDRRLADRKGPKPRDRADESPEPDEPQGRGGIDVIA